MLCVLILELAWTSHVDRNEKHTLRVDSKPEILWKFIFSEEKTSEFVCNRKNQSQDSPSAHRTLSEWIFFSFVGKNYARRLNCFTSSYTMVLFLLRLHAPLTQASQIWISLQFAGWFIFSRSERRWNVQSFKFHTASGLFELNWMFWFHKWTEIEWRAGMEMDEIKKRNRERVVCALKVKLCWTLTTREFGISRVHEAFV